MASWQQLQQSVRRVFLRLTAIILYHTLVQDGALSGGYEAGFAALAKLVVAAADSEDRNHTHYFDVDAAVWLHERSHSLKLTVTAERLATEQFMLAAQLKPRPRRRRFDARFQKKKLHSGPTHVATREK